jgi:hypothetical protein
LFCGVSGHPLQGLHEIRWVMSANGCIFCLGLQVLVAKPWKRNMLKKRGPEKTLFKSLHTFLQAVCQARESPAVKKRGWPNEVGDHTGHCRTCWSAAKSIPRSFLECI